MKCAILSVVPPLLLLAAASAQEPTGASRQPATSQPVTNEVELQSLQALVTETVYVRQPSNANPGTTAGAGTAADLAFARVRDAEFGPDGRLASLIVDAPPNAKGADKMPHVLSASSVRWDAATRRWLTVETTLQLAELPAYEAMKDKKTPVANPKQRPVLATDLLRSEAATEPAKGGGVAEASGKKAPPARIVWWFAPGAQQVAVAVMPIDGKHVLVPFAALRIEGNEMPRVRIESTAGVDGAPACTNADELPSKALRQQSYAHFGVTPPSWEREPDKAKDVPKDKPKDKDHDKAPGGDGKTPDKG